ncbi:peptide/nickel transport system substrate-binding protein [Bradyrhizobium lablabi]|uniref:Peptide/nickel transport system substrate-binding protein n=2 Tax=Bradyrhizobium TaxID=374 RepID=A0ABY0PE80_9BRAD|nr:peptide/nickel transport system substrate-binding protein [Bradyrhizobium ottawaense]SED74522.1 peptide/nickel transport system substrate-binding protein [Bradyrhizobium lablabi]SHL70126.1 peptide/nickel transport system substrate-binding protein [Bradyrhizobium lablabi]
MGIGGATRSRSASAATPQRGGVVTMVAAFEPPTLLGFVNSSSITFSGRTTEGLLEFDHNMNPQPLLATSWDVAPDGLTYTFKLREGVKWHDGEDFTSEDVAFSIAVQKKLHPRGRTTFAQIKTIETPDKYTVILHLGKPTPYLLSALSSGESPVVPKHRYGDADPLTHVNNAAPIGTGPYVFREWVRGSHVIWDRNPNYWNKPLPYVDRLVARFISDPAARTIAFETADVDLGYRTPVPYRDVERLKKNPKISFDENGYVYDPPNIIIIEANLENEYLKDLKVRQAIAHCIDRETICKIVFFGNAVPSAAPIVPYHKEFHNSKLSPYPYNVAAAAKLLDEAGYARAGSGMRFTLTMDYTGDDQRVLGEFLRSAMSRAGIGVELRGQDMGTLVKRVYSDRAFALHLASISNLFDPQVGVQRLYWSKNLIKGVPFSNGTAYNNPEVDALLEETAVTLDKQDRIAKWIKIQDIVMRDVPNFPIVMASWLTISQSRVKDHTTNAEGFEGSMARVYLTS